LREHWACWITRRVGGVQARELVLELVLELVSPLVSKPVDLGSLLGNAAHELVQWDLADSGLAESFGDGSKRRCDAYADEARTTVKELATGLTVAGEVDHATLGRRASRGNGGKFELAGHHGWLRIAGDLQALLPWFIVLELRGAGAKKSFGMGDVRVGFG
jgi:hypothetical protein